MDNIEDKEIIYKPSRFCIPKHVLTETKIITPVAGSAPPEEEASLEVKETKKAEEKEE